MGPVGDFLDNNKTYTKCIVRLSKKDVGRGNKVGGLNILPLTKTVDRKNSCTS